MLLSNFFCFQGDKMNSSFPGTSGSMRQPPIPPANQMQKLAQETELQKLLADEKMRSQMHKTNYEQLKEEHKRLHLNLPRP